MRAFALKAAPDIVRQLLEDDEDFSGEDFDVKELSATNPWEQIDGDFGDPWEYGGDWYNSESGIIWHFDGIEDEEDKVDQDEIPIPASMQAHLDREYPLDYVDPDGDLDWQARQRRDNEWRRNDLVGHYRYARAAYLAARKRQHFWEIHVDDTLDSMLQERIESVAGTLGMSPEEFEQMPLLNQMIEFGRYMGFSQLGHDFKMTKQEASKALGVKL